MKRTLIPAITLVAVAWLLSSPVSAQLSSTNVRTYCTTVDGTTDNTTCIQNAVNAICNRTGAGQASGTLFFPVGKYVITSVNIPCEGVYLEGEGYGNRDTDHSGSQIFVNAGGAASALRWQPTSSNYGFGGGVKHMSIYNRPGAGSTQYLIEGDYLTGFAVEDIYMWTPKYGIIVQAGIHDKISDIYMDQLMQDGTGIMVKGLGSNQSTRNDVTHIQDVFMGAATPASGHSAARCVQNDDFGATMQILRMQCVNSSYGVVIECPNMPSISDCPQFVDMRDVEVDFFTNYGLFAQDFQYIKCQGCYFHGGTNADNAVHVQNNRFNTSFSLELNGGKIDGTLNSCVWSEIQGLKVIGVDISNCNRNNNGSVGVDIITPRSGSGDASGHNIVSGNTFCTFAGTVPTTMYGVHLQSGVDYNVVTSNSFLGCAGEVATSGNANTYIGANVP